MPRAFAAVLAVAIAVSTAACGGSSEPDALSEGRSLYGDVCSACHGPRGQGGVGPSLEGVVATWPDCDDQVEWIRVGSEGWRAAHGGTYGAEGRPVSGGMPAQGANLSEAQIRLVAAFERAEYGGRDPETALSECGAG